MPVANFRCWVCDSQSVTLQRKGNCAHTLSSRDFAITDAAYGTTHDIYCCNDCDFLFCPDTPDVLQFYEGLVDEDYESSRQPRLLQADKLLQLMRGFMPGVASPALLDVGAGSGVMVEQAASSGWRARGVEPSLWLAEQATGHGLDVLTGTLPHPQLQQASFDALALVDVIEHVADPAQLLLAAKPYLNKAGLVFVVTPDVGSLAARLLGRRWWHYRLAHIGYFKVKNLSLLATKCGYEVVAVRRPVWYFSLDYLLERCNVYLPDWLQLPRFGWMNRVTVPLNLFDSIFLALRPL